MFLTDNSRLDVMPRTDIVPKPRRCLQLAVFACALLGPLSLLLPTLSSAESDNLDRRYSLDGSLELSYDRRWLQGVPADDFRQLLLLDHRGFVSDPKLLTYQISGIVSHDAGKGLENSTLMGGNVGLTLFRSLPAAWQKDSDYIPHPLWLRFSRESGNLTDYTSYGLSFLHSIPRTQRFLVSEETPKPGEEAAKPGEEAVKPGEDADLYEDGPSRTSKIVEKERMPFPRTFFDYDHYDQKIQDSRTVNDVLSLRSSLTGKSYDYRFLYENQKQTGSQLLQRSVAQLEPNYRFYDEETRRRIDINNLLRYEDYNQAQNIELGSNIIWSRPIGKNEISASGGGGYSGSSAARLTEAEYTAAASANYRQYLSPRLTNSTSLLASIKKRDTVDTSAAITRSSTVDDHTVRLSDTVTADISRLYGGTSSAFVGNGVQGMEYGASATLFSKTRIITSLSYSYSLSAPQLSARTDLAQQSSIGSSPQSSINPSPQVFNGRISKHDVALVASGPLLNNLVFQGRADLTLSEAPVSGGTSTEETGTLSGNLLWRLPKTSMALGGNYSQSKRTDTEISASTSTSLFATLTRVLPMRMLFNFYSNWTKTASTGVTNSESTRLELRPTLRWTRGLTSVDTEYSYTRSSGGADPSVDQRFFVRLIRRFSAVL
jgi:hypothetical protein